MEALAFDETDRSLNLLREAAAVGVAHMLTENDADCETPTVNVDIGVIVIELDGSAVIMALIVVDDDEDIDGDPLRDAADAVGHSDRDGPSDVLGITVAL